MKRPIRDVHSPSRAQGNGGSDNGDPVDPNTPGQSGDASQGNADISEGGGDDATSKSGASQRLSGDCGSESGGSRRDSLRGEEVQDKVLLEQQRPNSNPDSNGKVFLEQGRVVGDDILKKTSSDATDIVEGFNPQISLKALEIVCSLCHLLPKLESIVVLESTLGIPHAKCMGLSLPTIPRLRQLDLSNSGIGNGGLSAMKEGLLQCNSLSHLSLSNCLLDDEAEPFLS